MDTIFAPATARGRAGIAVVRLSGPDAWRATADLAGPLPAARHAGLRQLSTAEGPLDEAIVLLFEHGRSFTGELMAELHLHGSVATIAAVIRALGALPGLRLADPGEFTRRALENGRLDLAQVEGLADLIDAETDAQRKQALRVLSGAVGDRADGWRRALIRASALLEATIDFADEDVPVDVMPEVSALLVTVRDALAQELAGFGAAERVRDGFTVAIVGLPNVGKSSLLNALAGREAAITSEYAGTTRDVIEVRMDLGGLAVTLLDTAGLRIADDPVEAMGISRAVARANEADLRVFLAGPGLPEGIVPLPHDIVVGAKADLVPVLHGVSGKTGQGVSALVDRIAGRLATMAASAGTMTRERHRFAIASAAMALDAAQLELHAAGRTEIVANHLLRGVRSLDSLVGRVDVEHILDEIFARFCIGK